MATVVPVKTDISGDGSVVKFAWTLTSADHTGAPISMAQWADRTITFTGNWGGATATAAVEGSNDGTTYISLADPQGTAISKTADAVEAILELTQYLRPRLTTVGVGATVVATIVLRRAQPLRV